MEPRANATHPSMHRPSYSTFVAALLPFALLVTACAAEAGSAPDSEALTAAVAPSSKANARALRARGAAIDVHTHIASQALVDAFGGGAPAVGADDLVARLDEAHVQRAVILSGGYLGAPAGLPDDSNMAPENSYVAEEVAKYPERLLGFCGINPAWDGALGEIDRCLELPGMVGVKLHLEGSGIDLADDAAAAAVNTVFDRIAERDVPVLTHVAGSYGLPIRGKAFSNLTQILQAHPTVRMTHAHCAGNADDDDIEMWLRIRDSGYDPDRSFVDISACLEFFRDAPLSQRELIVWRLHKWGLSHVLFGSDYFAYDDSPTATTPAQALETLTHYPFSQSDLNTILGNDASKWLEP